MDSVKFGATRNNPFARLSELQTGNDRDLVLAAYCQFGEGFLSDKDYEGFIHAICREDHMRGEWFHYNLSTIAVVEAMQFEMKNDHFSFLNWILEFVSPDLYRDKEKLLGWIYNNNPTRMRSIK